MKTALQMVAAPWADHHCFLPPWSRCFSLPWTTSRSLLEGLKGGWAHSWGFLQSYRRSSIIRGNVRQSPWEFILWDSLASLPIDGNGARCVMFACRKPLWKVVTLHTFSYHLPTFHTPTRKADRWSGHRLRCLRLLSQLSITLLILLAFGGRKC